MPIALMAFEKLSSKSEPIHITSTIEQQYIGDMKPKASQILEKFHKIAIRTITNFDLYRLLTVAADGISLNLPSPDVTLVDIKKSGHSICYLFCFNILPNFCVSFCASNSENLTDPAVEQLISHITTDIVIISASVITSRLYVKT